MKILTPLSNRFELVISIFAALGIHAAIFGLGFSAEAQNQPPLAQIKPSLRCEAVSYMPKPKPVKEKTEQPVRERVEKKIFEKPAPVKTKQERVRVSKPMVSSKRVAIKQQKRTSKVQREVQREKVEVKKRELAPKPDERKEIKTGNQNSVLSRAAFPAVKNGFTPTYPRLARRYGYEGRVELKVLVSVAGKVIQVDIHKSSGYAILDKSAIRQIKEIPFSPALSKKGSPIESVVIQGLDFNLTDARDN